jgi:hypothetical protein
MIMNNNKHSFWIALIVTFLIFFIGIFIGVIFENSRVSDLKDIYFDSETELFDILLKGDIVDSLDFDCNLLWEENIFFADQIYYESKILEKYSSSNLLTESALKLHRRYDLLRTMLWKNLIDLEDKCSTENKIIVVYLYDYVDTPIMVQAKQLTFSRISLELKQSYGDDLILIPIAYDTDVHSLNLLLKNYNLTEFPLIFINNKLIASDLISTEELQSLL